MGGHGLANRSRWRFPGQGWWAESRLEAVHFLVCLDSAAAAQTVVYVVVVLACACVVAALFAPRALSSQALAPPPLAPQDFHNPHMTAKLMQALAANAVAVALLGPAGLPTWSGRSWGLGNQVGWGGVGWGWGLPPPGLCCPGRGAGS